MVSLVDRLQTAFLRSTRSYDPAPPGASYGTYNVLWQIERCRELGLPHLYLGYWIARKPEDGLQGDFPADRGVGGGGMEKVVIFVRR